DQIISRSEFGEDITTEMFGTVPTGETTIIRNQERAELITEEMPDNARHSGHEINAVDYATSELPKLDSPSQTLPSVQIAHRAKSYLLFGLILVIALTAGGYGIYRYTTEDVKSSVSEPPAMNSKQVSTTGPSPAPTVAVESVPQAAGSPVPVVKQTPNSIRQEPNRADAQEAKRLAESHFKQAQIFYTQNQFPEALRESNRALRLNPRHAEARELRRKIKALRRILK